MGGSYSRHDKGVKASFDHIYDLEDPRGYFNTLGELDYQAPRHGSSIFSTLLKEMDLDGNPVKILDLCCSYGVNAALLKHEITLEDLYDRYGSDNLANLSTGELAAADAEFYEDRRSEAPPEVVGVDVAGNAVSYAVQTSLLDAGFTEDLEKEEPSEALREAASGTDLLTVTGGIGYVWKEHLRPRALLLRRRRYAMGRHDAAPDGGLRAHYRSPLRLRVRDRKADHPDLPATAFRGRAGAGPRPAKTGGVGYRPRRKRSLRLVPLGTLSLTTGGRSRKSSPARVAGRRKSTLTTWRLHQASEPGRLPGRTKTAQQQNPSNINRQ